VLHTLQKLPDEADLWRAAAGDMTKSPVTTVLGWFESNPVDSVEPELAGAKQSLWLVCKFEGLQPAQAYLSAPLSQPAMKLPFQLSATQRRFKMLKAIFKGQPVHTPWPHTDHMLCSLLLLPCPTPTFIDRWLLSTHTFAGPHKPPATRS
jgi:hypothetical protein